MFGTQGIFAVEVIVSKSWVPSQHTRTYLASNIWKKCGDTDNAKTEQ